MQSSAGSLMTSTLQRSAVDAGFFALPFIKNPREKISLAALRKRLTS